MVIVRRDLKTPSKAPNVFLTDIPSFLHTFIDYESLAKIVQTQTSLAVSQWNEANSASSKVDTRLPVDKTVILDTRSMPWTKQINHSLQMIMSTYNFTRDNQSVNSDVFINEDAIDVTLRYRAGKSMTRSGLFMPYAEFLFMLKHVEFRDFVDKVWAFAPLDLEYTNRLGTATFGKKSEVYSAGASGDTESDDDLEPYRKVQKRKRVVISSQSLQDTPQEQTVCLE